MKPNHDRQIDFDFDYPFYGFRFNYTMVCLRPVSTFQIFLKSSDLPGRPVGVLEPGIYTAAVHVSESTLAGAAGRQLHRAFLRGADLSVYRRARHLERLVSDRASAPSLRDFRRVGQSAAESDGKCYSSQILFPCPYSMARPFES